jgi:NADH-quinone oxidoreductase subunit H
MSAVIVTLFLGGPGGPIPSGAPGWVQDYLLPFAYFFGKLLIFLFVFVWFRATLPRFRYDQLMDLGWKVLIPLALGWFLFLTSLKVADDQGWNPVLTGAVTLAVVGVGAVLLRLSIRAAEEKREEDDVRADTSPPVRPGGVR